jgi:hypothetical protein
MNQEKEKEEKEKEKLICIFCGEEVPYINFFRECYDCEIDWM